MRDNIVSHLDTTKILHWKQNWFWFFFPWGAFPTFKYSAASLAHQHQVCSCSAAEPIQQWVYVSEGKKYLSLPSHHLPSKHLISQRTGQLLKQRKWLELAQFGPQENKGWHKGGGIRNRKGVPLIPPLAS